MTWKIPLLNGIVQDESENLDDLVNEVYEELYGKPTINRENKKDKKHSRPKLPLNKNLLRNL